MFNLNKALGLKALIKAAKSTIIFVAVLTVFNTILITVNSNTIFAFSVYIPQFITFAFSELAIEEGTKSFFYIGVALSLFISLVYVAIWLGAKKKDSLIILALVLFSVDTAFLLYDAVIYREAYFIIDLLFHGWIIFELSMGVYSYFKLKKLPVEDDFMQQNSYYADYYNSYPHNEFTHMPGDTYERTDSTPIRISENKGRKIMAVEYNGMNVEVRRSMGLTELIVNGKVYAEQKGIIETEYTLSARVSGVEFSTTMTIQAVMFLFADGRQIAKKIRII